MNELTYTLLADGTSDRALMHIINWLLNDLFPKMPITSRFATLLNRKLDERIENAIKFYPCDVLFVHRDAENESYEKRKNEIERFWKDAKMNNERMIPIIPIRITETWFLINEQAIKLASGNPNSKIKINLPKISELEKFKTPKETLFNLIREANDSKKRNMKNLDLNNCRQRVAENIESFALLRELSSFQKFEHLLQNTVFELSKK